MKLVLGRDYPHSPPRAFFLTKIFHPNVATNGDICVNMLKRDWNADLSLAHMLQVRLRLFRGGGSDQSCGRILRVPGRNRFSNPDRNPELP